MPRSEEHTSELQSPCNLVCRLLLEKKQRNTMAVEVGKDAQGIAVVAALAELAIIQLLRANHNDVPQVLLVCDFAASFFFFNDSATPEIYPLSLHRALPV